MVEPVGPLKEIRMKPDDILALMDEPACAHNKKSKSGCAKPQPGATQGGCCFDGARNALLPIADVAHVVHGPIGCAGSSWDNRGTRSSGADLYRIGMTTDLSDLDVIMGRGEKRLFQAIKQAIETYRPAAVFVYVTCVPALHGDDVEAVTKAAAERFGVPVVPGRLRRVLRQQESRQPGGRRRRLSSCHRHPRPGSGAGGGRARGHPDP